MKHTPTPWELRIVKGCGCGHHKEHTNIIMGNGKQIPGLNHSDAEFIVRACNNHYALLDALKEFINRVEIGEVRSKRTYKKFKELIAKAKGE